MARVATRPRHRGHDHPVLRARHPRRVGLQLGTDSAQVQRPPPAPARPVVIARATTTTHPAPATLATDRPHRGHQHLGVLVELDPLDHRLLDPKQTPP